MGQHLTTRNTPSNRPKSHHLPLSKTPISTLEILNSTKEWESVVVTAKMTQLKKSLMVKIIAISYTLVKQEDDLVADSKNTFAI